MAQPKVIGYTRVSTSEQLDGYGLAVQEKAIRSYCRSHKLRLVAIHSDEGISGSNGLAAREGLATALQRLEGGEAGGLIVYRRDRLARDFVLAETLHQQLTQQGIQVLSVKEPETEGDEAVSDLIRQVLGVVAEYERKLIKSRMQAGKAHKVAQGGYGGGRPAYGYRATNGDLVVNPDELAIVEQVTNLRTLGASYREIAKALANAGLSTRTGGQWNPNQVRRIAQRSGVE